MRGGVVGWKRHRFHLPIGKAGSHAPASRELRRWVFDDEALGGGAIHQSETMRPRPTKDQPCRLFTQFLEGQQALSFRRAKNAVQVLFRFTNVFADNAGEIDLVKVEVAAHDSIEFSVI